MTLKKNWINGDMETGHYEHCLNPAFLSFYWLSEDRNDRRQEKQVSHVRRATRAEQVWVRVCLVLSTDAHTHSCPSRAHTDPAPWWAWVKGDLVKPDDRTTPPLPLPSLPLSHSLQQPPNPTDRHPPPTAHPSALLWTAYGHSCGRIQRWRNNPLVSTFLAFRERANQQYLAEREHPSPHTDMVD
ncbi:hypothetical protein E2C01_027317 [Portunus trituberculatus]|uniref:Uncharacterized protein n=1 Tax=Portunus trituberculatus TaxID=210409 RepID=A0A5B7EL79_PORTR|nr:hypothetical protein [Portunus trituberculatus]